jgi:ectoine hydroxylase-related dioxygenase (phytanoyl-CoA dioxygenase family)
MANESKTNSSSTNQELNSGTLPEACRPISEEEIQTYARDGVVCLRQVFDPDWTSVLLPVAKRITEDKEDFGLLPTYPGRYMARTVPEFRRFVFESSIAEAAARVMQSKQARFFFDEFFAKPPKSGDATIWHNDRMGWPTVGKMVPSIWIPLTSISKENSLECIPGSQVLDDRYWLFSPNARQMTRPDDRVPHPDGDKLRADPNNKFLQWDMEPGDILLVHPWTLHYSHGNSADSWRIAVSIRVFGDDIRWHPRPDCLNVAGVSFDEMIEGEAPGGDLFPLLWSDDGRRDGDARYPRGFATSWTKHRRSDINEYDAFKSELAAEVKN